MISAPPLKTPGMPGVATNVQSKNLANLGETHSQWAKSGMTPKYPYLGKLDPRLDSPRGMLNPMSTKKLGASGYADKSSPLIREIEKRYSGVRPNLPGNRLPNPLKTKTMANIMDMRRNPGIAQGLGKMKGRAYSSLNQPGSVVAGTKRGFTNMLRTDKNFEKFVVDMVGPENVAKIMNNPKIRKTLIRDYLRTVRTGVDNFPPHPDMGTPATTDDIMKMFGG